MTGSELERRLSGIEAAVGLLRADLERLYRQLGACEILNEAEADYWLRKQRAMEMLLSELRRRHDLDAEVAVLVDAAFETRPLDAHERFKAASRNGSAA